jgi:hypothetical protein
MRIGGEAPGGGPILSVGIKCQVRIPRLVIRLSPQSAKDLGDVLQNFVANFERAYGELRADYLLRKQTGAA